MLTKIWFICSAIDVVLAMKQKDKNDLERREEKFGAVRLIFIGGAF